MYDEVSESVAFDQNWGILKTRMNQRGITWKWILTIFKCKMNATDSYSGKCRWKNEVICLISMLPSWVMVLKLSKKVHFMQFCANLSKKLDSVKAISLFASESSHYTLSESGMVYRGLSHCSCRRATSWGEGGRSPQPFFENRKKVPWSCKKVPWFWKNVSCLCVSMG